MIHKMIVVLAAATVWTTATLAQNAAPPPAAFQFVPAKDVVALTDQPGPGVKAAFFDRQETYFVEYAARTDAGNEAEMHARWAHHIDILEGEGTLTYGGTISNARETAPGELRGGTIQGAATIALHPGDYVQIPAGMPHLVTASAGKKLRYVIFNTRQ